jgi:hypothetical protein
VGREGGVRSGRGKWGGGKLVNLYLAVPPLDPLLYLPQLTHDTKRSHLRECGLNL